MGNFILCEMLRLVVSYEIGKWKIKKICFYILCGGRFHNIQREVNRCNLGQRQGCPLLCILEIAPEQYLPVLSEDWNKNGI